MGLQRPLFEWRDNDKNNVMCLTLIDRSLQNLVFCPIIDHQLFNRKVTEGMQKDEDGLNHNGPIDHLVGQWSCEKEKEKGGEREGERCSSK